MDAKLTIGRRSSNTEDDYINISIKDKKSSVNIIELKVLLKEMMSALTGYGYRPVEIEYLLDSNQLQKVGKKLETKYIFIDKLEIYEKERKETRIKDIINSLKEAIGWELFDDGCRSQQPTDKHKVIMRRWV